MSSSSYDPAPPPPGGETAELVNGRPMSPRSSYWPDRRPVAAPRATLTSLATAAGCIALPFVIDLLGGPPWRALWLLLAFGIGFVAQAGMDTARPRSGDRVGVWTYRLTYLFLPVLAVGLVVVVGDPFAANIYR